MSDRIEIARIAAETLRIPIIGTSPLIVHRWNDKAKRQMLDAQQGKKKVKEIRDPEADYQSSLYRIDKDDGTETFGFPVLGFKAATIGAARFYDKSVTMTSLRQCMFFRGVMTKADSQQLVEINGSHVMREDIVRVGQGTDLRYRAMFPEWSATLSVTYVSTALDKSSILSLVDAGGMGVGVGEWRPQKNGEFGTYAIDQDRDIEVVSS